ALGALASTVLLDPHLFPAWLGWRLAFLAGAVLAIAVVLVRRHVPESPRWLMLHGRHDDAVAVVEQVEAHARACGTKLDDPCPTLELDTGRRLTLGTVARTILVHYRSRAVLGLSLMLSQAFFYNAIFFTYALVLTNFFAVQPNAVGWYLLPFAGGNLLGPL